MMEADQGEGCEYPLVIAGGAATFAVVNTISGHLAPQSACNTKQQKWKWRNVATSLIHSIITGTWALAVFYKVTLIIRICILIMTFNSGTFHEGRLATKIYNVQSHSCLFLYWLFHL